MQPPHCDCIVIVNQTPRDFVDFSDKKSKGSPFPFWLRLKTSRGQMAKSYFKQEHDLEKRRAEAARIREKYPDRIPVIVEKAERSDIPNIDKKKIKLSAEKAIFIFVDNVLPPTGAIMSAIYEEKKDEDGFLYITYSGENTFGYQIPL
ncbi:hypothetical protein DVH24_001412 [Malus domestica]|uniref:Autophagy-related protein n=1 Tax=Malus domestica TaxID=3750 RepID=A0A498K1J2_MALDO|nr:hypothetical protein DVH24_001412 [Malus domestica]